MILDCPGRFCFLFRPAGTQFSLGVYDSIESAIEAANIVALRDMCGTGCLGPCRRDTRNPDHADFYEPHEPNLERAGLPLDQFMTEEQKKLLSD